MQLWKAYQSLMEKISTEVQMLYLTFSQTLWLLVLIIVLAMITLSMLMTDSTSTIR